eukprot:c28334_g1_i1.p1 GENE.c28334_g1_i1~~c28334_g1_i1.p1  ORF type:complete len:172 (+),score=66.68 c28334_g1_i1:50-517(+)
MFEKIGLKIISNVVMHVSSVHIRYEHINYNKINETQNFTAGITITSLVSESKSTSNEKCSHKLTELKGLSLYINPNDNKLFHLFDENEFRTVMKQMAVNSTLNDKNHVIKPCLASLATSIILDDSIPKGTNALNELELNISEIDLQFKDSQFQSL